MSLSVVTYKRFMYYQKIFFLKVSLKILFRTRWAFDLNEFKFQPVRFLSKIRILLLETNKHIIMSDL